MTGLELARAYWETYGVPMIHDQFPEYEEIIFRVDPDRPMKR